MQLSNQQVSIIKKLLSKSGLDYKGLYDDLIDHYCCIIENELDNNKTFEQALQNAINEFPLSEINKVQLFTLGALNMERNFSFKVSLLATTPFLLLGLMSVYSGNILELPYLFSGLLFFGSNLSMFALFIVGWVKDFPRWSVPAVGFCIIISLLLMNISIPIISGGKILGFWALIPFALAIIISIVMKPSLRPLKKLTEKYKDDMSLIIFSLYGILPLFIILLFDEMSNLKLIPILISISLIISLGAFFYLYSNKKIIRTLSLIFGTIFSLMISLFSII